MSNERQPTNTAAALLRAGREVTCHQKPQGPLRDPSHHSTKFTGTAPSCLLLPSPASASCSPPQKSSSPPQPSPPPSPPTPLPRSFVVVAYGSAFLLAACAEALRLCACAAFASSQLHAAHSTRSTRPSEVAWSRCHCFTQDRKHTNSANGKGSAQLRLATWAFPTPSSATHLKSFGLAVARFLARRWSSSDHARKSTLSNSRRAALVASRLVLSASSSHSFWYRYTSSSAIWSCVRASSRARYSRTTERRMRRRQPSKSELRQICRGSSTRPHPRSRVI
mmetsp:Transcript_22185/g.45613  ORF Transcript_22185/g.45613 Transcript_22185/m.45613 type:complete len:280 (+) Transcript_22185:1132-1971(+)